MEKRHQKSMPCPVLVGTKFTTITLNLLQEYLYTHGLPKIERFILHVPALKKYLQVSQLRVIIEKYR